jgi:hypothetical protein
MVQGVSRIPMHQLVHLSMTSKNRSAEVAAPSNFLFRCYRTSVFVQARNAVTVSHALNAKATAM